MRLSASILGPLELRLGLASCMQQYIPMLSVYSSHALLKNNPLLHGVVLDLYIYRSLHDSLVTNELGNLIASSIEYRKPPRPAVCAATTIAS